jgi:ABC transporter substrate binding protein
MRLIGLAVVLALAFVLAPLAAGAQQAGKVYRIGYLILPPLADPASAERQAFLEGVGELGYVPDLAAELVERKVDVILAAGPQATLAAREETRAIPIVMITGLDPVESGLVNSLARPGANVTGFSANLPEPLGLTIRQSLLVRADEIIQ